MRYNGFFNVIVIDLKIFSFHKLLQKKIWGRGRQKKGRPIPGPEGGGLVWDGESRAKGSVLLPLLSVFSMNVSFLQNQGTIFWNWNPWHRLRGLEVDAQILGVTCDAALGPPSGGCSDFEVDEPGLPGYAPTSLTHKEQQGRPELSAQKVLGVEMTVLYLRASCRWHRPSLLDVVCDFYPKESKMTSKYALHLAPTGMVKRTYFLLLNDLRGKQMD